MKQKSWILHFVYLLVIATLFTCILGINYARLRTKTQLRDHELVAAKDLRQAFARLCTELSGDLYSAVEADDRRLYLSKLVQVQTAVGQAQLLLSNHGRQTPWITFWESLGRYAESEMNRVLETEILPTDRTNLKQLAELNEWLSEHPEVLLDETTESLPDELRLPTLQTAYAVEEAQTRIVACRVLGVRGGLTYRENGPPGVRSYTCANARVDVLQSGKLFYFSIRLKQKEGTISQEAAAESLLKFAKQEGFGNVQIIDLYIEDGLYRGKLAPLSMTESFGKVPDLDRTLEIACAAWNGRICYFSAGRYFTFGEHGRDQGSVSESKIEALAKERGARIGPAFFYRGRICRPLIYERGGLTGRTILCVDAATAQSVDLFYLPHARVGEKVLF